jgi:hypothetical protein
MVNGAPFLQDEWSEQANVQQNYVAIETSRRAARLLLALEAWKARHGALPKTIDELVGPCLDRVPVDPYSGKPFCYFRDGVTVPFPHTPPEYWAWSRIVVGPSGRVIGANTPFIWSTGPRVRRASLSENPVDGYEISTYEEQRYNGAWDQPGQWRKPHFECDISQSGWPFPIP